MDSPLPAVPRDSVTDGRETIRQAAPVALDPGRERGKKRRSARSEVRFRVCQGMCCGLLRPTGCMRLARMKAARQLQYPDAFRPAHDLFRSFDPHPQRFGVRARGPRPVPVAGGRRENPVDRQPG